MKKWLFLIVFFFLAVSLLTSQEGSIEDLSEEVLTSITYYFSSLVSDSFSPMTDYEKGDTVFVGVPVYTELTDISTDPDVSADPFRGGGLGFGIGYAWTDRLMTYGILSAFGAGGVMTENDWDLEMDCDFFMLSFQGGAGFELFQNDWLSLPVFGGFNLHYYKTDCRFESFVTSTPLGIGIADIELSNEEFLFGFSGGAAASFTLFSRLSITPYLIFISTFSGPSMEGKVTIVTGMGNLTGSVSVQTDPLFIPLFGLNVGLKTGKSWKVGINAGSLLTSLTGLTNNDKGNGLRMIPVVLSVSYYLDTDGR